MNELREAIRDILAGWPIGSGYYSTAVGVDEAWEMADAVMQMLSERETYDEGTLTKVYWALGRSGLSDVQNAGILFRERGESHV